MKFFYIFFWILLSFNRIANAEGFGSILIGMEKKLSRQAIDKIRKDDEVVNIMPSEKKFLSMNERKELPKFLDEKEEDSNGREKLFIPTLSNMINGGNNNSNVVYKDCSLKKCSLKSCESIVNDWHVERGDTLRSLLYKWSKMTGWDLVWDSNYDYKIDSSADIHKNFISAVRLLAENIGAVNPPIFIDMYEENKVIRVKNSVNK